jgi:hypothetical protein
MANPSKSLAQFQANRAVAAHAVGLHLKEYEQPAHAFLAKVLPDSPELHRQVALPGARRAVHMGALENFHARGLAEHEMVAEVNTVTDQALAPRLRAFEAWRDGPRAETLERARRREAKRAALKAQRDAEIERALDRED